MDSRYRDRFVPARDPESSTVERFQTSKAATALSATEKIVRNVTATQDPFSSRRRHGPGGATQAPTGGTGMIRPTTGGERKSLVAARTCKLTPLK